MKRLGTALHVVQKKMIVQSDSGVKSPRIGSTVVDRNRAKIGRISDVFGPVLGPYVVVRPNRDVDSAVHVGKMLYFDDQPRRDGKWKR